MNKHTRRAWFGFLSPLMLLIGGTAAAADASCFLKDGDRWVFFGDSITNSGVYPRVVEKVFRHFHPEAKVTFVNKAVGGKMAAGAKSSEVLVEKPTVVSMMFGMNDAINSEWVKGKPVEPVLEQYRANMTRLVREIKAGGAEVILMTPTRTDLGCGVTIFRLEGTDELLTKMGKVCAEVAQAEGAYCLPAQEMLEDCQKSRPSALQRLRYDGVHVNADGHYRLAQMFWEALNFSAPLTTSTRNLQPVKIPGGQAAAPANLLTLQPVERMLNDATSGLRFQLSGGKPGEVKLHWSLGSARGSETLALNGSAEWAPNIPAEAYPSAPGKIASLVIEAENAGEKTVFYVDLNRDPVLRGKDGVASGVIRADQSDPQSPVVCRYELKAEGKALTFTVQVKNDKIVHDGDNAWPWTGDCVTAYLDLRPGERYGRMNMDGDVYQFWFQPRTEPTYTPGFRPWYGQQLEQAATPFGEKTAEGYSAGLVIDGWFTLHRRFDASKLDFVGLDLSIGDCPELKKPSKWYGLMKTELPTFLYTAGLQVVDLRGKLKGEAVTLVNVYSSNDPQRVGY